MVDFGTLDDLQGSSSSEEASSISFGNPAEFGLGENLNRSNLERLEETPELKGVEAALARFSPNAYGVVGVALDMVPYARYALPSEREKFYELEQDEQTKALLWDAFGATTWVGAPVISKGVGKGVGMLFGALKKPFAKVVKPLPIEDALAGISKVAPELELKPFVYREVMQGTLQGKGMTEAEARWVTDALEGTRVEIESFRGIGLEGKAKTKTFLEMTEVIPGRAYETRKVRPEIKLRFAEDQVRGTYYNKQFEGILRKEVFRQKGGEELVGSIPLVTFDELTKRLWPDMAKVFRFDTVGEAEMANIVNLMLTDKAGTQSLLMAGMKHMMPLSWMPARVAFGTGEPTWGMVSRVYNPVKGLFETTNRYHFNKMLEWAKILEQEGLLTAELHPTKGFVMKGLKFGAEDQKVAYEVLRKQDDLMFSAVRGADEKVIAAAREEAKGLAAKLPRGGAAHALVQAWHRYSDKLYSEYMIHQIPRVFRKGGFNRDGLAWVEKMMGEELEPQIKKLFATSSSRNATEIFGGIKGILGRGMKELELVGGRHPYLPQLDGDELKKALDGIGKMLTPKREKGMFMPYLENYTARLSAEGASSVARWSRAINSKLGEAGFTKSRYLETMVDKPVDFSSMIEARTYAQAKELFLNDGLEEVMSFVQGLPPAWMEYTEHWLSRALNRPSVTDVKTAMMLQKSIGSIERLFGGTGVWDERRVMRLASNINNVVYMGALGFKPFSVIRNLFQPLLLVPADLGGLKDLGTLASGAARAMQPKVREKLIGMGVITDYAPEITMRPAALPFGKPGVFGMSGQQVDSLRDFSLWMFRGSDRWNRYVTGGAAMTKWERGLAKLGLPTEMGVFPQGKVDEFAKAINLNSRHPWKAQEIKDLLWRGNHDEAMATYIRDVVADTQYLYGTLDAPVITGRSAVARTGFIFQTWWMNYLTTMEKWVRTGNSGVAKADRLFTGMLSAAIAEQLMEPLWGRRSATRAVGLGPVPGEVNEFTIPPAWTPIYHGVAALVNTQDPDTSVRHWKALLGSLPIFIPGGLQASQMLRGAKKEGFEGFLKSVVRYNPDEEE